MTPKELTLRRGAVREGWMVASPLSAHVPGLSRGLCYSVLMY